VKKFKRKIKKSAFVKIKQPPAQIRPRNPPKNRYKIIYKNNRRTIFAAALQKWIFVTKMRKRKEGKQRKMGKE
jgi:hypothetical protein